MQIRVQNSPTADSRTCDPLTVSMEQLARSSKMHIVDVHHALFFFAHLIGQAQLAHDTDKITDIEGFHANFVTGFKEHDWWDRHRKLNRHHLEVPDGVPADVNLIDVLDHIADGVMAGMARSGEVRAFTMTPDILMRAFQNTVDLLKAQVVVVPEGEESGTCN